MVDPRWWQGKSRMLRASIWAINLISCTTAMFYPTDVRAEVGPVCSKQCVSTYVPKKQEKHPHESTRSRATQRIIRLYKGTIKKIIRLRKNTGVSKNLCHELSLSERNQERHTLLREELTRPCSERILPIPNRKNPNRNSS